MSDFQPLRIRAYLQSGVLSDGYLPIDGILYSHHVRNHWGAEEISLPNQSYMPPGKRLASLPHLPLKQINSHTKDWYYAASFAQWPAHTVMFQDAWSKRLDLGLVHLLDQKTKRVDPASGKYKGYRMPVFGRSALWVEWYVVGQQDAIEQLLTFVLFLGKKPAQGYGAVLRWEVQTWPEDWSVYGPQQQLMRAIPALNGSGLRYGLRPSYHNPQQQILCLLPQN